jgi:hypothetical protein
MHNTQIDSPREKSVSSAGPLASQLLDIDFDAIKVEQEYFYGKRPLEKEFIGSLDESTEIDSLLNSMTSDMSLSRTNSENEEILHILRSDQKCRRDSSQFSRSHPEFFNKKISLQGRVLKMDSEVSRPVPLLKARTVPERVSNPFLRNFDSPAKSGCIQY